MTEYSVAFAGELIKAARLLEGGSPKSMDRDRSILYLSLLSAEIALKALLEKAGFELETIVQARHDLDTLQNMLTSCEIPYAVSKTEEHWVAATGLRARSFTVGSQQSTVGAFLSSESKGASKYPNDIRYGDRLVHFPPDAAVAAAELILAWANENWDNIRRTVAQPALPVDGPRAVRSVRG